MSRLFSTTYISNPSVKLLKYKSSLPNLCSFEAENIQHKRTTIVSARPNAIHLTFPTENFEYQELNNGLADNDRSSFCKHFFFLSIMQSHFKSSPLQQSEVQK